MKKLRNSLVIMLVLLYSTLIFYIISNIITAIKNCYFEGIYEIGGNIFIVLLGSSIPLVYNKLKEIRF